MVDLKKLREDPERFRTGAKNKGVKVDIDRLLELDTQRRAKMTEQETLRASQKSIAKESGPRDGPSFGSAQESQ